jgi:hypothetical protein
MGEDHDPIIAALRELVEALDRRVPRVERVGEGQIARDAAKLRNDAVTRIGELEGGGDRPVRKKGRGK